MRLEAPKPYVAPSIPHLPHRELNHKRLQRFYGELIGAAHKVQFVAFGLAEAVRMGDLDPTVEQVEYHIENYLSRVYQLGDRASAATETAYGKSLTDLSYANKRPAVFARLEASLSRADSHLSSLIQLVDRDIQTRNTLTHRTALHLRFAADDGQMFDPTTVPTQISDHPDRKEIERALRTDLVEFVGPYIRDQ